MLKSKIPSEEAIRSFWDAPPCGNHQVQSFQADYEEFFERYDRFRYSRERRILRPARRHQLHMSLRSARCSLGWFSSSPKTFTAGQRTRESEEAL
jgi:hypothetical protein